MNRVQFNFGDSAAGVCDSRDAGIAYLGSVCLCQLPTADCFDFVYAPQAGYYYCVEALDENKPTSIM